MKSDTQAREHQEALDCRSCDFNEFLVGKGTEGQVVTSHSTDQLTD